MQKAVGAHCSSSVTQIKVLRSAPDGRELVVLHSEKVDRRQRGPKQKSRRGWIIGGSVAVVACALYGGAAAYAGSQMPANTTVHGIDVGSLTPEAANDVLREKLAPLASKKISVLVNNKEATLDPASAGLSIDYDKTLNGLTGFDLNPVTIFERFTGQQHRDPVSVIDEAKLLASLDQLAPKVAVKTTEGKLAFDGSTPVLTKPITGVSLNVEDAVNVVSTGWFDAPKALELPSTMQEPKTSLATLEAALQDQAKPLVSGPIKLTDGTTTASLTPGQLAATASFKISDNKVEMTLDTEKLVKAASADSSGFKSTAKEAKIVLSGGKPKIIPSQNGTVIESKDLDKLVLAASKDDARSAKVTLTTTEPELTTEKAKKLGVKNEIVHFSTPYPASDTVRTKNLYAGTARLNGVVVMPGETFSLEKALGAITTANGYYGSGVVVNGFATEAVGGGLSQVSTQLYNVGFLAGYDDITHKPHSRWFERYPAGREATLWEGQVDMAWKNNTPYAVMIQAWVGGGEVHTRLWSTKYWTVGSDSSAKHNITKPGVEYNPAENCKPESGGKQGFSIDVTRTRSSAKETLPAETKSWTYQPWNKVICGTKP